MRRPPLTPAQIRSITGDLAEPHRAPIAQRDSLTDFASRETIARWQLRAEVAVLTSALVLILLEGLAGALTRGPA